MILISELFIVPILLLSLLTISQVARILRIKEPAHQYAPIDGLRGLLAMLVFIHHSSMWYMYSRIHEWAYLGPTLFIHFGPTSVMMFFMITAFLFFSKLLDAAANGGIDWLKLYVSRVLRIAPLYLLAVLILFILVGFATHFSLRESLGDLFLEVGQWLFIMEVDINGYSGTKYVISGVQWSLAYEWFFYCSLTISGWAFFDVRSSWLSLFVTTLFLIIFALIIYYYYPVKIWLRLSPFLSGLVAALLSHNAKIKRLLSSNWLLIISGLSVGVAIQFYPDYFTLIPISLLFINIACGNSLFGLLTWKPCRLLGQISYSVYLLHGLLLFATFHVIVGFEYDTAQISVFNYWSLICASTIVLIIICSLTYRVIEEPNIRRVTYVTQQLRDRSFPTKKRGHLYQRHPPMDGSKFK